MSILKLYEEYKRLYQESFHKVYEQSITYLHDNLIAIYFDLYNDINSHQYKNERKEIVSYLRQYYPVAIKSIEDNFKLKKMYKYKPQIFACQGGIAEFQIDQKGDVYPCPLFMEEEFKLFNILDIANPEEFIASKKYIDSKGYYNFSRYLPENIPMCSKCEKQLMCFTCAAEIKKMMINGKLERRCAEYNNYFDMYWRDYERI